MRRLFVNPFTQVLLCAISGTAAEVFLKIGASLTASARSIIPWLGLSGLLSGWVWLGIVFTLVSFYFWIRAVRALPLSVAFTLTNVTHVLIPLSCWVFLGEVITARRWAGIALVVTGLLVIAKPFAMVDSRL